MELESKHIWKFSFGGNEHDYKKNRSPFSPKTGGETDRI